MNEALATLHGDLRDLVGHTIAERYRVDDLIGVGGMGAVFRAQHLALKRDVAIKVLHPDFTRHPEISARFDREAHSASRLDHPNCVTVTDYGTTDKGMKFMAMQLLEGGELSKKLGKVLSPIKATDLTLQILRGLDHAHKQGVVHRDVKPENIFITRQNDGEEVLKLVDFGIAKLVSGGPKDGHKTRAGLVFGTPAYMSPEQAAGLDTDERADLYSVGVILYQMLAGKLPLDHDDAVALVRMQVSTDPPPLPSTVPPVLAAVVQRLLAKAREDRFQTAAEAVDILEGLRPLIGSRVSSLDLSNSGPIPTWLANSASIQIATVERRSPFRDKRVLAVGVGLVAMIVALAVWPSDEGDAQGSGDGAGAAVAEARDDDDDETEEIVVVDDDDEPRVGPDPAELNEIDSLIHQKRYDDADKVITQLLDTFPDDPELWWWRGRVLAANRRKVAQALAAYGKALEGDPVLLQNNDFYLELNNLMRKPSIRKEALDLALHKMGDHGHRFLVEVVNDAKRPLPYHDRQRALQELDADAENRRMINRQLNMALDLLQAKQSLTPCTSYRQALEAIAAEPDFYFYSRVNKAPVVEPPAEGPGATKEDAEACKGLAERRAEVLKMLVALAPPGEDPTANEEVPEPPPPPPKAKPGSKKKKKKKKKSSSKPKQSVDCKKFGSVFKKKCWK